MVTGTCWQEVGCSEWTGNLSCTCVPEKANSSINKVCLSEHVTLHQLYYITVQSTAHPQFISLLFASVCYFLFTRLMFFNILCMFVFLFVCLFSIFCVFLMLCVLFLLGYIFSLSYFCTSLRNTATMWKPNCSK